MRARILIGVLAILLTLAVGGTVYAGKGGESIAPEKQADIKKMLTLSGMSQMGIQFMKQMLPSFKKMQPSVPDEFWKEFMAGINPEELEDLIVPIYDRHFTHDDIIELIKFYESPIGRKLVRLQPQIMQESMLAGQKWGQRIAEKVVKKLKEKGYK